MSKPLIFGAIATALAGGAYAMTRPKKKRSGLPAPLTALYEYGDVVIAVWRDAKQYKWGLYHGMEVEDVKASRGGGKWIPPVGVMLRDTGAELTTALAKTAAQAAADSITGMPVPLEVVYDHRGFVIAITLSERDAARPYEWYLFPGGTIDSVVSSTVPDGQGGEVWIPPDGLDVAASGRSIDRTQAEAQAEAQTQELVGSAASTDRPSEARPPIVRPGLVIPPSVPISIVKWFGEADPTKLERLPGIDEAVASPDCSVIATGPLFWERAGTVVAFLIRSGITSTSQIRDGVLQALLPGCQLARAEGIDALRKDIVDAVRFAKQQAAQGGEQPNA